MNFISFDSIQLNNQFKIDSFISKNYLEKLKIYPKALYLMAGVHGDEKEGIYVLERLFDSIKSFEFPFATIVIPVLNPYGEKNGTRTNMNQVDLNRNLPTTTWSKSFKDKDNFPGNGPGSELENQFLISHFEKIPPGLIITFHSWKPILNFNDDCKDFAEFISSYNGYPVSGDIGYPTPGSLGTYGPEKFACPVLTYECPKTSEQLSLENIWSENKKGLIESLRSDLILRFLKA